MKKGLLLGAGFSYDLGMPLASGLTNDFFHFLNEERIERILESWSKGDPYGEGNPIELAAFIEIKDLFKKYREDSNSNYENCLKELEDLHKKYYDPAYTRTFQFAFLKFRDMLNQMFYMYHVYNMPIYETSKRFYQPLSDFIGDEPTWVLTLNHDLFIEFLCMDFGIPFSFGSTDTIAFPMSNRDFSKSNEFECNMRGDMQLEKMNFIEKGRGINIIKLHGSINEYTYNDDKVFAYVKPEMCDTPSTYLTRVSSVMHEMTYLIHGQQVRPTNEIAVSDSEGVIQFLKKSIKTGGSKYSKTINPKSGEEKLNLLDQILAEVDELTIVGYSFCDSHVNNRLLKAMYGNDNLKIWIVNPSNAKNELFEAFDYNLRVRGITSCTPEWLNYSVNKNWEIESYDLLKLLRSNRSVFDEEYRKKVLK